MCLAAGWIAVAAPTFICAFVELGWHELSQGRGWLSKNLGGFLWVGAERRAAEPISAGQTNVRMTKVSLSGSKETESQTKKAVQQMNVPEYREDCIAILFPNQNYEQIIKGS
jgi:hypothetical protein